MIQPMIFKGIAGSSISSRYIRTVGADHSFTRTTHIQTIVAFLQQPQV